MHLKQGDPKPHFNANRLTLIGFRFCPYVDRVRLTLSYHKVEYDLVNISLSSKPDWFLEMYPTGKVPLLLLENGKQLPESDVIMRHIDSVYGSNVLLSRCGVEGFEKAIELAAQISRPQYMIVFGHKASPEDISLYQEACSKIDSVIKGPFFTGSDLSLADLLLFPHLHRFEIVIGRINGKEPEAIHELDANDELRNKWPKLIGFLDIMRKQKFVADVTISCQLHARYAAAINLGNSSVLFRSINKCAHVVTTIHNLSPADSIIRLLKISMYEIKK
ncbi:unnamed protein product [Heterobilharzia americana]|nr:unnamed protein product [Heterobilharzia americana]